MSSRLRLLLIRHTGGQRRQQPGIPHLNPACGLPEAPFGIARSSYAFSCRRCTASVRS